MFNLLGVILIIIVIIALTRRPKRGVDQEEGGSDYQRGFMAGYDRAINHFRKLLDEKGEVNQQDFARLISEPVVVPNDEGQDYQLINTAEDESAKSESISSESSYYQEALDEDAVAESKKEELAPDRTKLTPMQNLNILLGLGSLLFVAAGIAFIASGVASSAKLIGIFLIVILFYGGGITLYVLSRVLRPAAIAFVGTGLALIPFVAVALNVYGGMPSQWAWLVVSIIGFVAYVTAAVILKSQVVAYLSIGFLISLVGSGVAVGQMELFWYGVSFISLSLVLSIVSSLKPSWLPEMFTKPVLYAGQSIGPVTMLASVLFMNQLSLWQYEVMSGLLSLHYVVAWLQTKRAGFGYIARGLLQITAMLVWTDIVDYSTMEMVSGWIVITFVQQLISLVRGYLNSYSWQAEIGWLVTMCVIQWPLQALWWTDDNWPAYVSSFYAMWLIVGLAAASVFRRAGFLSLSILALAVLPSLIGFKVVTPELPIWAISLVYGVMTIGVIVIHMALLRSRDNQWQYAGMVASGLYLSLATTLVYHVPESGAGLALAILLLGTMVAASHIYRQAWLHLILAVYFTLVGWKLAVAIGLSGAEMWVVLLSTVVTLGCVGTVIYWLLGDRIRRYICLVIAQATVIPLVISLMSSVSWWGVEEGRMISVGVLMVGVIGNLVAKLFMVGHDSTARQLHLVSYIAYYALALVIGLTLPVGWLIGMLVIGIALAWEISYGENVPWAVVAANIFLAWMVIELLKLASISIEWSIFGGFALTGVIIYIIHWLFWHFGDEGRRIYMLGSAWIAMVAGSLFGIMMKDIRISGAVLMMIGAATVAGEGWRLRKWSMVEGAGYVVTLAVTIILMESVKNLHGLVYVHIWTLVLGLVAVLRRDIARSLRYVRAILGMSLVTIAVGIEALVTGGVYSLMFLVEHIALLVAGVAFGAQWAVWWGIIAAVLAVTYYLRESPYVMFALLGLSVVAFVIWRLSRSNKPKV